MLALTNVAIANCFHLEYASLLGELVAETRRERERERCQLGRPDVVASGKYREKRH